MKNVSNHISISVVLKIPPLSLILIMSNLRKSILHRTNWQCLRKIGGEKRIREITLNNFVFMVRILSILIKSTPLITDLKKQTSVVDFIVKVTGKASRRVLKEDIGPV